jgi:hypothetical protein
MQLSDLPPPRFRQPAAPRFFGTRAAFLGGRAARRLRGPTADPMQAVSEEVIMVNSAALAGDLARDATAAAQDDRRIFGRTEPGSRPTARVITNRAGDRTVGLVKDLSQTGMGLVLGLLPAAGQFLIVELEWQGRARRLFVCVVHTQRIAEGKYRVGTEFFDEMPLTAPDSPAPESWLGRLPAEH